MINFATENQDSLVKANCAHIILTRARAAAIISSAPLPKSVLPENSIFFSIN